MSDKNYANLHYPGMRVDPKDGKAGLSEDATRRFGAQMALLGDEAQLKLLTSNALILSPSPLGILVAQKLALFGLGRIGLFGDAADSGAHGFPAVVDGERKVSKPLLEWGKVAAPWCKIETFSDETAERQLEDIVPGFSILVAADRSSANLALFEGERRKLPVIVGSIAGRAGWVSAYSALSPDDVANVKEKYAKEETANIQGVYYPALDDVAGQIARAVFDFILA